MEAEDSGEMGDTTGASAMDQDEKTADETLRATKKEVDDAFEILVRNATEEFGFAPRDVYNGVFFLRKTKWDHATALGGLKYPDLLALVGDFSKDMKLDDTSHRVVAVFPRAGGTDDYSLWEMAFKSVRIAREVTLLMRLREDDYLRKTYDYLHRFPEALVWRGGSSRRSSTVRSPADGQTDPHHSVSLCIPTTKKRILLSSPQIPLLPLTPHYRPLYYAPTLEMSCELTSPMDSIT